MVLGCIVDGKAVRFGRHVVPRQQEDFVRCRIATVGRRSVFKRVSAVVQFGRRDLLTLCRGECRVQETVRVQLIRQPRTDIGVLVVVGVMLPVGVAPVGVKPVIVLTGGLAVVFERLRVDDRLAQHETGRGVEDAPKQRLPLEPVRRVDKIAVLVLTGALIGRDKPRVCGTVLHELHAAVLLSRVGHVRILHVVRRRHSAVAVHIGHLVAAGIVAVGLPGDGLRVQRFDQFGVRDFCLRVFADLYEFAYLKIPGRSCHAERDHRRHHEQKTEKNGQEFFHRVHANFSFYFVSFILAHYPSSGQGLYLYTGELIFIRKRASLLPFSEGKLRYSVLFFGLAVNPCRARR